jgi:4-guanidinobutyraldehyde dehydrogenase / NAD-dependent aldehyde dehydrogenase
MTIAREEIFGPVMGPPLQDRGRGRAMANDSAYGLQASVWSDNLNRAHRVARALRAGTVHVNQYDEDDITVPFGGSSKAATAATRACTPSTSTPS